MTTTGLPASLLPTLAGHYYTDPRVFAAEQAAIFESLWFCAMRSAELSAPGQFRTVQVGRENVIVVRARDGRLHAFLNRCPHRGARVRRGALLCPDEHCTVRRNFRCAYHSWTYGLDGRLVAAPNLADLADVDRA